ncbi:MAG TPA: hypothetical protein VIM79_04745 [Niastella sp.]
MKALLLIGASLMAGAGIYGYADFKKANLKKEFQSLYRKEPPKVAQEAVTDIASPAPPKVEPDPVEVPVYVVKNGKVVAEKKSTATKKKAAKKKHKILRAKEFSRAALEEEIISPEVEGEVKP